MPNADLSAFQETLWSYYAAHKRNHLPWRQPDENDAFDPYKIMVSEIMLQQTQVDRVLPKYLQFIATFPTVQSLAQSPLSSVLQLWQGLGYNRRAKFLWQAAGQIDSLKSFPQIQAELVKLPGIGIHTAGAIIAYAYNQPAIFIETNVRTVYIYHFFQGAEQVSDAEIHALLETTIDAENPREFYWALMDYGTYLKKQHGNITRLSSGYKKQSIFQGSRRQIRGAVIRELTQKPLTFLELQTKIVDDRLPTVLQDLVAEGLVQHTESTYHL